MRRSRLIALLLSATLHLAVVAPSVIAWRQVDLTDVDEPPPVDLSDPDDEGDEGELPIEPLPDLPFHVSLYVEPPPVAPALASVVTTAAAAPTAVPVVDVPMPALALPLPAEVVVAAPAPEPVPPEAVPEPVLSDEDRAALAEMEKGDDAGAPKDDEDEDEAFELDKRQAARALRRSRSRAERNSRREPCPESSQAIARVDEAAWYIDRDLIEYYATHMRELQKLGSVWTHRDKVTNELDGFRVGLSRCSVLRQGGLRSGDIVHDINGRRIHSVLQAVGAYLALRKEPELFVRITRKGEPLVLAYTIEQPARGPEARAERRAARRAARKPEQAAR